MQQPVTSKTTAILRRLADAGRARQIHMADLSRGGIACAVPAILAVYCHNPLLGWSAIAAFWSCISLPGGRFANRCRFALVFSLAGAFASGLGVWSAACAPLMIGLAAVIGFCGAFASVAGKRISVPALLVATAFAVSTAVAGNSLEHAVGYACYFLYGSLWASGINLLSWRPRERAVLPDEPPAPLSSLLRQHLNLGSHGFLHGVCVALATAIAVAAVHYCAVDHGYWMTLTVLLISQPGFAATLKVSVERVAGTLLGALIAMLLGHFIHSPLLMVWLILPLSIGTLACRNISYLAFTLFLTPHFILVAQLGQPGDAEIGLTYLRVLNSLAAALLVIMIALVARPLWKKRDRQEPSAGSKARSS
ncbi:FUSC family protein [Pseudomonas gingeri]|uniref:FUSC family protein n=1 Tax=Pseudomonas gingeri TaxID=117681 RepID=UPI0015A0FB6B|nr:FUSC family protein [Pseudomonas gingeri]NWD76511.1 FUSC family protein [Pseudomonas gingeri]